MAKKKRGLGWQGVLWLSVPCVAVLAVPLYNRIEPELFGIPFFYWWQILWVPLSSVFLFMAYGRIRKEK
ncbi:MAG: DUF3311 domain-containing protein [Acidithiobacillus sp.]|nr:DUF3311 domain-containing protein [Acidithiobacillus sp.]